MQDSGGYKMERESKLEESAYLLYQISPGNTRGESYAMQEMPFRSTGGG